MKLRNATLSALMAGLVLAFGIGATGAMAGDTENRSPLVKTGHRHGMVVGQHSDRHSMKRRGFGRMLRGLNLSEAQRDELFKLRHANAPQVREQFKAVRKARKALREMTFSGQYDEAKAQTLADALGKASADMAKARARMGQQVYQLLTEEQRAKLKERKARRGHERRAI